MDEAYYVGFSVGGQDVGLDPNGHSQGMTGPVGYWQVDDIEETLTLLLDAGAKAQQAVKDVGGGKLIASVKDSDGNAPTGSDEEPAFHYRPGAAECPHPGRSQPRSAYERRGVSAGWRPTPPSRRGCHRSPDAGRVCVCVQRKPSPDSPMPGLSALIRRWTSSIGPQAPRSEFDNTTTSSRSAG